VLRIVVLTQYRRVTERRTDGIGIASTALAMRALRRAVKSGWNGIFQPESYMCTLNNFFGEINWCIDTLGFIL